MKQARCLSLFCESWRILIIFKSWDFFKKISPLFTQKTKNTTHSLIEVYCFRKQNFLTKFHHERGQTRSTWVLFKISLILSVYFTLELIELYNLLLFNVYLILKFLFILNVFFLISRKITLLCRRLTYFSQGAVFSVEIRRA